MIDESCHSVINLAERKKKLLFITMKDAHNHMKLKIEISQDI